MTLYVGKVEGIGLHRRQKFVSLGLDGGQRTDAPEMIGQLLHIFDRIYVDSLYRRRFLGGGCGSVEFLEARSLGGGAHTKDTADGTKLARKRKLAYYALVGKVAGKRP